MDQFTNAYIACALWSSNDESTPQGGYPLDDNYGIEDLAPETLDAMQADCDDFRTDPKTAEFIEGMDEQAGHDFWLTRNHHGAGFWDRGVGFYPDGAGTYLTERSHAYGSCDLYIGNDGKVYAS